MAKRFWFVIPNEIKGNGMQWRGPDAVIQGREGQEFAEAAPRRAARPARLGDDVPVQEDDGYGFGLATNDSKSIMVFTTKRRAEEYAKDIASKNPQKLYGVFSCDQMYETTVPQVITKTFNDAGELVLVAEK